VRGWELATPRCDGVTVEALTTSGERRPRVVVVDEAWWLIGAAGGAGARFLQRLAKSARKHWCGLTRECSSNRSLGPGRLRALWSWFVSEGRFQPYAHAPWSKESESWQLRRDHSAGGHDRIARSMTLFATIQLGR
jgi:hypothetical protein